MLFNSAIWGVDSYTPTDRPSPNCLYDWVAKIKKPAFWGRYIRCPNLSDSNVLNIKEVEFLHKKGCAILPIYNRTVYQRKGRLYRGTFADGVNDAIDAISAARDLAIPTGVWIYADIEPDWPNVTTEWILGWWCVMFPSPYWPGLYCTLQKKYVDACTLITSIIPPPEIGIDRWFPIYDIHMKSYLWSFNPHRGSFSQPPTWGPMAPPGCDADVKIWQYCGNHLVGNIYVDADIATPDAFLGMWQAPAPLWQA